MGGSSTACFSFCSLVSPVKVCLGLVGDLGGGTHGRQ